VILAEVLGLPHVTLVMNIETEGAGIRVKRELEDGWFQHIDVPLPALLTIQSGATKLRYATLMGIKKARTKEVKKLAASELRVDEPATIRLDRIYIPGKTKKSQIFDGPAKESAAKLIEKLRFEARVI
jgi:electron transfer flavoprotein beta subunit